MAFSSAMFGPNTGTSMAQRSAASAAGKKISQMGRGGDTMAIHASPFTKNLLRSLGGSGGTNPKTGLTEFQPNYGDMTYTSSYGDKGVVNLAEYADSLSTNDQFAYDDGGYLQNVNTGAYLNTDMFTDGYADFSGQDSFDLFSGGFDPYATSAVAVDATDAVSADNTDAVSAYNTLYETRASGGAVPDMAITRYNKDGTVLMGYQDLIDAYTAAYPDGQTAVDSSNVDGIDTGLSNLVSNDVPYGGMQYQTGDATFNVSDQIQSLSNAVGYNIGSNGLLTYTDADGIVSVLDPNLIDENFTSAGFNPNSQYFSVVENQLAGDTGEGTTNADAVDVYNTMYQRMTNNGAATELVMNKYKSLGISTMGYEDLIAAYDAAYPNGETAVDDLTGGTGGDDLTGGTDGTDGTDGEQVFDASGAVIGTMLDGVFTPISAEEGDSGNLANAVADGVLAGTDPNDFAGQIATLKQEIAKLSASPEDDEEIEGINDFDGLITKLTELFEKYMSSGYSPAALLNMFGFTDGDVANDFNYMIPTYSGSDNVYTRKAVKDRDTGEIRYINVPIGDMASGGGSFREDRRAGFGSMF